MTDVVVLGTVAADIVVRVATLPRAGEQVAGEALGWRLGGSSANVAWGLATAGHEVELIGPVGTDSTADRLLAELRTRGIRVDRTIRVDAPAPRALILLDETGERTIVQLDASSAARAFPITDLPDLRAPGCIYVESYERFAPNLVERYDEALIVSTPPTAGSLRWPADIVVGSESQYPPAWHGEPFQAVREVAGSRLRWVIVTRGANGASAFGPDGAYHVSAPLARPVDSTGAGDAFAAGVVCGLLERRPIREAIELGAAHGAAAVELLQSVPPDLVDCRD